MEKMEKKKSNKVNLLLAAFLFLGFIVLIVSFSQAIEEVNSIFDGEEASEPILNASHDSLSPGKNIVTFDDYVSVKELVKNNPKIETVSYIDAFNQESVGYINFFGGIGKDFIITPGNQYEVFVKNYVNLSL